MTKFKCLKAVFSFNFFRSYWWRHVLLTNYDVIIQKTMVVHLLKKKLKKIFFWKNICIVYKIYIICRKKCSYMEKNFYTEISFLLKKNTFEKYRENYIWKCRKYISHLRDKIKYKSFLNIYSFCKKKFFWS